MTLPFSRFHDWLLGQLEDLHSRRGSRLALVAPRGSAKSTWVSLVYPLWAALHGYESYIVLLSDSQSQARLLLEAIKRELEDNPDLARAYPGIGSPGNPWGQDRIRLANGVVIEALGTGGKIRGRRNRTQRPTLIVGRSDRYAGRDGFSDGAFGARGSVPRQERHSVAQ